MVLFIILLLWLWGGREGGGRAEGSRQGGDIQDVKPEQQASVGASVHVSVYGPAMMPVLLRLIHTLPGAQTHATQTDEDTLTPH